jgi:hypothetical protein
MGQLRMQWGFLAGRGGVEIVVNRPGPLGARFMSDSQDGPLRVQSIVEGVEISRHPEVHLGMTLLAVDDQVVSSYNQGMPLLKDARRPVRLCFSAVAWGRVQRPRLPHRPSSRDKLNNRRLTKLRAAVALHFDDQHGIDESVEPEKLSARFLSDSHDGPPRVQSVVYRPTTPERPSQMLESEPESERAGGSLPPDWSKTGKHSQHLFANSAAGKPETRIVLHPLEASKQQLYGAKMCVNRVWDTVNALNVLQQRNVNTTNVLETVTHIQQTEAVLKDSLPIAHNISILHEVTTACTGPLRGSASILKDWIPRMQTNSLRFRPKQT